MAADFDTEADLTGVAPRTERKASIETIGGRAEAGGTTARVIRLTGSTKRDRSAMKHVFTLAAVAALSLGGAAIAQTTTQTANGDSAAQAAAPTAADMSNADNQAQYQSDMTAYEQSLRASHHEAVRDQVHYEHQRAAYADAMAAWRHQAYACKHGSNRACNAPTPNPADFY